jgi:hypothetical protein
MNASTALVPLPDAYESEVLQRIRAWEAEPPPPAARMFARAAGPASRAMQNLVPVAVLRGALDAVERSASRLSRRDALLRAAGVDDVAALRDKPLQRCDTLARSVERRGMVMAGGAGALLGVAGKAGLVVDVPALLTLAFRTIHRTGLCYGEDCMQADARALAVAIFALASANTVQEKRAALAAVRTHRPGIAVWDAAWRDGVERAAERELAKEAAVFGLNNLARSLSLHLGWRKALGVVPVMGALVGGSVNAWYIHDVAQTARYVFQSRRLALRYGAAPSE